MHFIIFAKDKPDSLELRMENRPAHVEHLNSLGEALKIGGPLLDDNGENPCGSTLLIEADSLEDAKAIVARDPYTQAGLFESVEIRPYNWIFGK